jgi:hypothetical protein
LQAVNEMSRAKSSNRVMSASLRVLGRIRILQCNDG